MASLLLMLCFFKNKSTTLSTLLFNKNNPPAPYLPLKSPSLQKPQATTTSTHMLFFHFDFNFSTALYQYSIVFFFFLLLGFCFYIIRFNGFGLLQPVHHPLFQFLLLVSHFHYIEVHTKAKWKLIFTKRN